jgi:hypothetical protein
MNGVITVIPPLTPLLTLILRLVVHKSMQPWPSLSPCQLENKLRGAWTPQRVSFAHSAVVYEVCKSRIFKPSYFAC